MARSASLILSALLLFPLALSAQDADLPDGWQIRADRPGQDVSEVAFVDMPPGWHVTTGPAVILWNPEMRAAGDFRAEMEVFLFDPEGRREAFGMFVGGQDLAGDGQRYTYFLLRDGGQFIVKSREGADAPTLVEWTSHDAIQSFADRDEGDSSVRNVLALEAEGDEVRFLVNGQEVATLPREGLVLDGVVGMRVNHRLNLHVSRLEVTSSN